eukprot:4472270-Pyramimonas_sp.AAC.1
MSPGSHTQYLRVQRDFPRNLRANVLVLGRMQQGRLFRWSKWSTHMTRGFKASPTRGGPDQHGGGGEGGCPPSAGSPFLGRPCRLQGGGLPAEPPRGSEG